MKKLLLSLLLLPFFAAQAQYCADHYYSDYFQNFLQAKVTYVQKFDDQHFDSLLEDALSKYWTLTKYKMVDAKRIRKEAPNKEAALLVPYYYQAWRGGGYNEYMELCLLAGGLDSASRLSEIANFGVNAPSEENGRKKSYYNIPAVAQGEFLHRLPDLIKEMNDAVILVKNEKSKFKSATYYGMEYMNNHFYNKRSAILKTKTLCVLASNVENMERIKKTYPYKIAFVNQKEFNEVVDGKRKDAVYLIVNWIDPTNSIVITDPAKHEIIYGRRLGYISTMDSGDFKKIAQAIKDAE